MNREFPKDRASKLLVVVVVLVERGVLALPLHLHLCVFLVGVEVHEDLVRDGGRERTNHLS